MSKNDYRDYLMHYNHNHDHLGRFSSSPFSSQSRYEKKTTRMAKKDAEEYARAKMFYGEGAGNRRKLINATVKQRSKDPLYKTEFDKHLVNQDMAYHATKAKQQRKGIDARKKVKKGTKTAVAVGGIAVTAAGYAHATGLDKKGKAFVQKVIANQKEKAFRRKYW